MYRDDGGQAAQRTPLPREGGEGDEPDAIGAGADATGEAEPVEPLGGGTIARPWAVS